MKATVNPTITISTMKNLMFSFVNIFMFLFKSRIKMSKAKGAQYTTTKMI
jgi:hypothetical protein